MRGLVIKNTGSWYTVKTDDGQLIESKIKGNFRLKGIRSTNPVAVGDYVQLITNQEGTAFISSIEDRQNYIIRKSPNLSKQSHILAANVDQALLVVTVNYPQTSTTFIDRFLAGAEAYRVPVIIIFNKSDILSEEELHYEKMMCTLYETIGYKCIELSAATGEGVELLRPLIKDKKSLLSGNSGVGKSTLINQLIPDAEQRTAEIVPKAAEQIVEVNASALARLRKEGIFLRVEHRAGDDERADAGENAAGGADDGGDHQTEHHAHEPLILEDAAAEPGTGGCLPFASCHADLLLITQYFAYSRSGR